MSLLLSLTLSLVFSLILLGPVLSFFGLRNFLCFIFRDGFVFCTSQSFCVQWLTFFTCESFLGILLFDSSIFKDFLEFTALIV